MSQNKGSLHLHATHKNGKNNTNNITDASKVVKDTLNNTNKQNEVFTGKKIPNTKNNNYKPAYVNSVAYNHKIIDKTNLNNTGIILLEDEVLEKIRIQSGPLAPNCEYQVHYWSLVIRAESKEDKSFIDICIPTVFFNYKQEVSGATIDFELTDVEKISRDSEPVHDMMFSQIHELGLIDKISKLFPEELFKIRLLKTNLNSIHKHPGSPYSQSFSGTDLNKSTVHDTGIVYPLTNTAIENQPNFAGIMAHEYQGEHNKVAHYEYRVVNGKIDKTLPNSEITYSEGRCHAYVKKSDLKSSSAVNDFLGFGSESKPYSKDNDIDSTKNNKDFFNMLHLIWDNSTFKPFTDLVLPEHITEKRYAYTYNKSKNKNSHQSTIYSFQDEDDDYSDWYNTAGINQNASEEEDIEAEEAEYIRRSKELVFLSDQQVAASSLHQMRHQYKKIHQHYTMDNNLLTDAALNLIPFYTLKVKYKTIRDDILDEIEIYDKTHTPSPEPVKDDSTTKDSNLDNDCISNIFKPEDFDKDGNFINKINLANIQKCLVQAGFKYIEFVSLTDKEKLNKLNQFIQFTKSEEEPSQTKDDNQSEAFEDSQDLEEFTTRFKDNPEEKYSSEAYVKLMSGAKLNQEEIDTIYSFLVIEGLDMKMLYSITDEELSQKFLDYVHNQ